MIRFIVGLLLVMGGVGGMDNPAQASYLFEQVAACIIGLLLMLWAVPKLASME